jgi:PAS domain-containing protein
MSQSSQLTNHTESPTGLGDAWVITNAVGDILDISPDAARLLNLSQRGARGRNLATFFVEDRPRLLAELLRAADGSAIDRMGTLQPRDRKPVRVHLDVSALPRKPGDRISLRWVISRDRQ